MTKTALAASALLFLVTLSLVSISPPSHGNSACAEISDREVRLRCYDAEYRVTSQSATEPAVQPTNPSQSATPATPLADDRASRKRESGKKTAKKEEASKAALAESPVRGYPRRVVRITTRGVDKRLVFELDNGERWVQTRTQTVTIRVKDAVAVKSSMTGRKYISTARGSTTWVEPMP